MKVLQLGPYPPPWGGVQANLVAIREYLLSHGHGCAVINITRHRQAGGEDVYFPRSAAGLVRLLWQLRYDVLHLHIGGELPRRLLGLCLACNAVPGRRTVLTFHSGGYPSSAAGRTARPGTLRGFVFRRFDAVIGVNAELASLFHRFGVPKERVHLIAPHAISAPDRTAPYPQAVGEFIGAHKPLLIAVGLLEPEYDLPLQIEALGRVRERFPGAGLLIAGSGSLEQELRRTIAAAPWREHVLLYGDLAHKAALRAIAESDAMLRTTRYDGDSISVREALAAGTPVIATDNGMRPTGVRLIPARNTEALLAALEQELARPERRAGPAGAPQAGDENVRAVVELYGKLATPAGGS